MIRRYYFFLALFLINICGFSQNCSHDIDAVPIFGNMNTGYGQNTMSASLFSIWNTAMGFEAMPTIYNFYNSSLGAKSLFNSSSGEKNTAVGFESQLANSSGHKNVSIGYQSLYYKISGIENAAIGYRSLRYNTFGSFNTAIGYGSLKEFGGGPLTLTLPTESTTACGFSSLERNLDGQYNTALGSNSLNKLTSGNYCNALGANSLFNSAFISNGNNNIAIGFEGLYTCLTGEYNIGIGYLALRGTDMGSRNVAIGGKAGYSNISGLFNVSVGANANYLNSNGSQNTAIGSGANATSNFSSGNTAVGTSALPFNNTGQYNTALGASALLQCSTGSYNTGLGTYSDLTLSGSYNYASAIGYQALVNASNKIWLGNTGVTYAESIMGILQTSDARFKSNVQPSSTGLNFVMALKPVTYRFDSKALTEHLTNGMKDSIKMKYFQIDFESVNKIKQTGFIAQDVAAATNEMRVTFNGVSIPTNATDNYALNYALFVVPLVKAIQEQQSILRRNSDVLDSLKRTETHWNQPANLVPTKMEGSLKDFKDLISLEINPNPFSKSTEIIIRSPQGFNGLAIEIVNLQGQLIYTQLVENSGNSVLKLNSEKIGIGVFLCILKINGEVLISKKIISVD